MSTENEHRELDSTSSPLNVFLVFVAFNAYFVSIDELICFIAVEITGFVNNQ